MYEWQVSAFTRALLDAHNLSDWKVELTDAIEYMGRCSHFNKTIRVSRNILGGKYPDSEIDETIRHEIAHALTPGHGHDLVWRDKLLEIGGRQTEGGKCNERATATGRATTKLKEKCPDCGKRAIQSKREIIYIDADTGADDGISIDVTAETHHIPTKKTVIFGKGAPVVLDPEPAVVQVSHISKITNANDLLSAALGGAKARRVVEFGTPKLDTVGETSPVPMNPVNGAECTQSSAVQPEILPAYSFADSIRLWENEGGAPAARRKAIRITLQCGHAITEILVEDNLNFDDFVSMDGKRPWSYQIQSVEFARDNNFCALFNLDMGLGKTIIMCMLLWKYKQLRPTLIVCNSTIVPQVCYELYRWAGIFAQRITSSKETPHPELFDVIVTTYDLVGKIRWEDHGCHFKSIFLDECQKIKSQSTNRTQSIIDLIQRQSIEHRLFMSNTPIKNNAGEYFVALNLLDQYQFPNRKWFINDYCDWWKEGRFTKIGGIRRDRQDQFMDATKHFIIRFTRPEVQPDLPPVFVQNKFVEIDERLKKAHDKAAEEFMDAYYAAEGEEDPIAAAAIMQSSIFKLKHIVGLGKVQPCIEYITDFLQEHPGEKIVIFAHHNDVMSSIYEGIKVVCETLELPAPMTLQNVVAAERFDKINRFRDSTSCVLIAPTLSCGEGTNLQFAHWGMLLERQWNPANEIQVHGRFSRPGQEAKEVFMIMMIALDSTDQYLTEIVEQKFDYVSSALGDKVEVAWNERSVIQQLAAKIMSKKGKKVA